MTVIEGLAYEGLRILVRELPGQKFSSCEQPTRQFWVAASVASMSDRRADIELEAAMQQLAREIRESGLRASFELPLIGSFCSRVRDVDSNLSLRVAEERSIIRFDVALA